MPASVCGCCMPEARDARGVVRVVVVRERAAVDEHVDGGRDRARLHSRGDRPSHPSAGQLAARAAAVQIIHNGVAAVAAVETGRAPVRRAALVARRQIYAVADRLRHRWAHERAVREPGGPRRAVHPPAAALCRRDLLLAGAPAEASGVHSLLRLALVRTRWRCRGSCSQVRRDRPHAARGAVHRRTAGWPRCCSARPW